MANTVYGPYSPTNWVDNSTQGTHVTLNNLETQSKTALHGFNADLLTPFIHSGVTCAKDGTVANQLDVAAGRAYLTMTDGTLGLIIVASTTFTTATPSTTYYLDLNPDGSWSWATSHSVVAGSAFICSVATDASGNISSVTDLRGTTATLLPGMTGSVSFSGGGVLAGTSLTGTAGTLPIASQQSGAGNGISFKSWNGTAGVVPFSVGGQFNGALSWIDNSGNLTAGNLNFGQALGGSLSNLRNDTTYNVTILQSPQGSVSTGILFETHTAPSTLNLPFSIGGQIAGALGWVNNDGSINVPKITLTSGSTFTRLSTFTASGISGGTSTAINHGLGATPAGCAICPNLNNGSATVGAGGFTSTQVTVTIGNSGSGPWAVMGIAWA